MGSRGPLPRTPEQIIARLEKCSILTCDGCKEWRGNTANGYGVISINGKNTLIHRWIYQFLVGPIANFEVVRHTCDNKRCWNKEHLKKGTDYDNTQDKVRKNRHIFGEKHYLAKLDNEKAREIRRSILSSGELSRIYGVSRATIQQIKKGLSWKQA